MNIKRIAQLESATLKRLELIRRKWKHLGIKFMWVKGSDGYYYQLEQKGKVVADGFKESIRQFYAIGTHDLTL
jgi:esterase/lipase superfamily enzyme